MSVVSRVCLQCGRANPPWEVRCSGCEAHLDDATSTLKRVARPVIGKVQLTGGLEETLDRDLIIGRDPGQPALTSQQRGIVHGSHDRTVSRRQVELKLDGWHVFAVALGSRMLLRRKDGIVSELQRGTTVPFEPGDTLHYGSGLSLRYADSGSPEQPALKDIVEGGSERVGEIVPGRQDEVHSSVAHSVPEDETLQLRVKSSSSPGRDSSQPELDRTRGSPKDIAFRVLVLLVGAILVLVLAWLLWPSSEPPPPPPREVPEPATTTVPAPATTTVPEPATTTVPAPATTTVPEPATTTVPAPATTTVPEPATTTVPEPATTTVPEPATTTVPEPATTTVPEPATTTVPEPATTTVPEPATTTVPEPAEAGG